MKKIATESKKPKQIIRLTESDLHNIIKESVKRILKEHDPDDPDYGQYGDAWDAAHYVDNCESECSVWYYFLPKTKQLIPEPDEEIDDDYYELLLTPKFCGGDEYGFEMDGLDFEFDSGDRRLDDVLYDQYGELINKLIDADFDSIYEYIKKNSTYHIY